MKLFREHNAPVTVSDRDLKGQGGEAVVYVRDGIAYKVYREPGHALSPLKIEDLSAIAHANVIKPESVIRDGHGSVVGYEMREVRSSLPMCRLFPKTFRDREGLKSEHCLKLFTSLRELMSAVHRARCLVADPNEMNFLVDERFTSAFAIDCDSYGTPRFKPTAIMPSVRDFLTWPDGTPPRFTEDSDWYGFGVVTLQLWIGIHPYKGTHPTLRGIEQRAKASASIFDSSVHLPHAALPIDSIPPVIRDWYRSVFQDRKRSAPPDGPYDIILVVPRTQAAAPVVVGLVARMIHEGRGEVRDVCPGGMVVTMTGVYQSGKSILDTTIPVVIGGGSPALFIKQPRGTSISVTDAKGASRLLGTLDLDAVEIDRGSMLGRNGDQLVELEWKNGRAAPHVIGTCMPNSTTLFRGCAIQEMLGATWASLVPSPGRHHQVRLREVEGSRVIEAELQRTVLAVVAERSGVLTRYRYRFSEDFTTHDVVTSDITNLATHGLNFAVLDQGILVESHGDSDLLVCSARPGSSTHKLIRDGGIYRLYPDGTRLLGVIGDRVYHLTMQ